MHNDKSGRTLPAEWETDGAILMAWPHSATDWAPMLDEVTVCYVKLVEAITKYHPVVMVAPRLAEVRKHLNHIPHQSLIPVAIETNDTWARDFGPITLRQGKSWVACDFRFNGWGLKFAAQHDNLINMRLHERKFITCHYENRLGFVLEGGSIDSDGRGTILTTSECLLSPNRNGEMTKDEIETYLRQALGADRILWLNHGALAGDDTDSHIDTLARFAPNDTILFTGCQNPDDEHFAGLSMMKEELIGLTTREGLPYNLIELPLPDAVYDDEGNRLPATYANFLATPKAVFLPTYRQSLNDELALKMLAVVFDDREIVPVDCLPLIKQHGSLHCVTMQLPKESIAI